MHPGRAPSRLVVPAAVAKADDASLVVIRGMEPAEQIAPAHQPALRHASEITASTWAEAMSAGDESYTHQIVAPRLLSARLDPTWAERTYLSVRLAPDLMFNAGRAVYPFEGVSKAFVSVSTGTEQHAVRVVAPFAPGEDPDDPQVGPVRIEVVEPLRELRLTHQEPGCPLQIDLRFRARVPVVPSDRNIIEIGGEVVTDYMNFYQSGYYEGTISLDGRRYEIEPVAGFRDRGWGMRKHEGAPRRGFVLFAALEFADTTIWLLLYESANGVRRFTNGWLVDASGIRDTVTGIEHDLDLAGMSLRAGRLELSFASGVRRTLEFTVDARIFLAAGGYTARTDFPPPGYSRYDTRAPDVLAMLDGQNDHGCTCALDGEAGLGFIETGFGVHPRYRPQG